VPAFGSGTGGGVTGLGQPLTIASIIVMAMRARIVIESM